MINNLEKRLQDIKRFVADEWCNSHYANIPNLEEHLALGKELFGNDLDYIRSEIKHCQDNSFQLANKYCRNYCLNELLKLSSQVIPQI